MPDADAMPPPPSIGAQTTDTFEILPGRADAGLVLICDHATNAMPEAYGTLGLGPAELRRHIAYDIGAAEVVRGLSRALGVPAVLSRYSLLLIDPNRGVDDPTLIMRLSDGAVIPGNRRIDAAERERRTRLFYQPYHDAIRGVIDRCMATGTPPALLSVHSFTESWKGTPRPWHAGVLWDRDARLARPLLEALYAGNDLIVGDNEPYTGRLEGDCMWQHGTQRGLAHAIIEIRQDLIRDAAGEAAWTARLERIMRSLLGEPELQLAFRTVAYHGPHADTGASRPRSSGRAPIPQRTAMSAIDSRTQTELEAAAYRRLVEHLRNRTDVQNIDLMNLAGFCRNCLANWYMDAARANGLELSKDAAREIVYGMPYKEWQARYQKEASAEKLAQLEVSRPKDH